MRSKLDTLMWEVYNSQGREGGDIESMRAAIQPLTVTSDIQAMLCDHLASKGFVSPAYIKACMQTALDFSEIYPASLPLPLWNDYAIYVQGAKFD